MDADPMDVDVDPSTDPSHAPLPPTDGDATTAARNAPPNVPAESRQPQEPRASADLGQGTPNPASDVPPTSDPTPVQPANKPKSAFVKIMELGEEDMLMAWMDAFFGRCFVIQLSRTHQFLISVNRSLLLLR